jgi:hypothetical protein
MLPLIKEMESALALNNSIECFALKHYTVVRRGYFCTFSFMKTEEDWKQQRWSSWDAQQNTLARKENIWEDYKTEPVGKKLAKYEQKFLKHDSRTEDIKHPK